MISQPYIQDVAEVGGENIFAGLPLANIEKNQGFKIAEELGSNRKKMVE